jgi:large subunit ribosomal protein L1
MEKETIKNTLIALRESAPKRNFKQTIDLIINLKDLDLKKPDNKVDTFVQLHFDRGKKVKVCGLVAAELLASAKSNLDMFILSDDFQKYNDKKKLKKLAEEHSFFIAQANIMPQVASVFGKVLGSRGKMPNPKAGCVVPPNANLGPLVEKLRKTIRIKVDTAPLYQVAVGTEDSKDDEIADNVQVIYSAMMHALPNEIHNIKNAYLKFTMSKALKIQEKEKEAGAQKGKKKLLPKHTDAKPVAA